MRPRLHRGGNEGEGGREEGGQREGQAGSWVGWSVGVTAGSCLILLTFFLLPTTPRGTGDTLPLFPDSGNPARPEGMSQSLAWSRIAGVQCALGKTGTGSAGRRGSPPVECVSDRTESQMETASEVLSQAGQKGQGE